MRMKKVISLVLSLIIALSLAMPVTASEWITDEADYNICTDGSCTHDDVMTVEWTIACLFGNHTVGGTSQAAHCMGGQYCFGGNHYDCPAGNWCTHTLKMCINCKDRDETTSNSRCNIKLF